MPTRNYSNVAVATTLNGSMTNVVATMTLTSKTGWPTSFPFAAVIEPNTANQEIVDVTSLVSGNQFNVTRGVDGSTAVAHSTLVQVLHESTARDNAEANAHINASAAVHGLAGTVVGTTDTQTLTNKTIAGGSNTLSAIATTSLTDFIAAPAVTLNTWTNPTLTNSWVNAGVANTPTAPGYWVSPTGLVIFRGMIKSGTGGSAAFALPAAIRPAFDRYYTCHANSGSDVQGRLQIVASTGAVTPTTTWTNQISLDGVMFQVG